MRRSLHILIFAMTDGDEQGNITSNIFLGRLYLSKVNTYILGIYRIVKAAYNSDGEKNDGGKNDEEKHE